MIQMPLNKIINCFFILTIGTDFSYSQNRPVVQATVDRNKILIGEPIRFSLEVIIPPGKPVHFVSVDTIPHFEFLEKGTIDTTTSNNSIIIKQVARITSFDSGRWVIPAFAIPGFQNSKSDTIGIEVGFAPFDRNKDYNDIKEIIDVPVEKPRSDWYWYAALGVAVLILIIYLLIRKKPKVAHHVPATIDPYKDALLQLDQLQKENLPGKGEIKTYYSRLVDIFRFYVLRKKNIMSLQKTMDDLIIQIKLLNLPQEEYSSLAQALRLADFVKFAKYIPSDIDNQDVFSVIKNSISRIEKNK